MINALECPYFCRAFGWCVPIGGLGGLIGLGGGAFRLPVLVYGIGFDARSAVPLNLLTSLITLTFSLAVRSGTVSLAPVVAHIYPIVGLAYRPRD
jgi:uncharacterized protein